MFRHQNRVSQSHRFLFLAIKENHVKEVALNCIQCKRIVSLEHGPVDPDGGINCAHAVTACVHPMVAITSLI